MTLKQIERLPYGSGEQRDAADEWMRRFIAFARRHPNDGSYTAIWRMVMKRPLALMAKQRLVWGE